MTFYVGQKVVCVDDSNQCEGLDIYDVRAGQVYTIRWVGMDGNPDHYNPFRREAVLAVRLVEVYREREGPFSGEMDMPFRASRFRPLIERSTETGMAILRKVADDAAARRNLVRLDQ